MCINAFSEQSVLVLVCSCSSVMPELEIFPATRCTCLQIERVHMQTYWYFTILTMHFALMWTYTMK